MNVIEKEKEKPNKEGMHWQAAVLRPAPLLKSPLDSSFSSFFIFTASLT